MPPSRYSLASAERLLLAPPLFNGLLPLLAITGGGAPPLPAGGFAGPWPCATPKPSSAAINPVRQACVFMPTSPLPALPTPPHPRGARRTLPSILRTMTLSDLTFVRDVPDFAPGRLGR